MVAQAKASEGQKGPISNRARDMNPVFWAEKTCFATP